MLSLVCESVCSPFWSCFLPKVDDVEVLAEALSVAVADPLMWLTLCYILWGAKLLSQSKSIVQHYRFQTKGLCYRHNDRAITTLPDPFFFVEYLKGLFRALWSRRYNGKTFLLLSTIFICRGLETIFKRTTWTTYDVWTLWRLDQGKQVSNLTNSFNQFILSFCEALCFDKTSPTVYKGQSKSYHMT